jgi:hypothetical protein
MKIFFKALKIINFSTLFNSNLSGFGKIKKKDYYIYLSVKSSQEQASVYNSKPIIFKFS